MSSHKLFLLTVMLALGPFPLLSARAQVGGVLIDADGILRSMAGGSKKPKPPTYEIPEAIAAKSTHREISLRAVDQQIRQSQQEGQQPADELRLLAGLTRIDSLRFDPARRDIWLGGPAEGWVIAADGREIGESSGRAVLHWEELATALRAVLKNSGAISCSIDPTADGLVAAQRALEEFPAKRKDAVKYRDAVRNALGQQVVSTSGVPPGSRFARTMVEADYLMKRMAVGAIRVSGVSNHLDALVEQSKEGKFDSHLARWWFTHDYEPPEQSADRTTFRITGPRLQLLNEQMMVDEKGGKVGKGAGTRDRFSIEFTRALPDLVERYPVFSDLANLYDLVWVSAVIKHHNASAWLEGSPLLDETGFPIPEGVQPRFAEPLASHDVRKGKNAEGQSGTSITVAYGGVDMNPGAMIAGIGEGGELNLTAATEGGAAPATASIAVTEWWHDATKSDEEERSTGDQEVR